MKYGHGARRPRRYDNNIRFYTSIYVYINRIDTYATYLYVNKTF